MDKYHKRRLILKALATVHPGPVQLDFIAEHPSLEMAGVTLDEIRTELQGLVAHGFVKNARPGRAPLLQITAAGLDQIRRDADPLEYVWGEHASKFQA